MPMCQLPTSGQKVDMQCDQRTLHIIIYGKNNLGLLWTELCHPPWPNLYVAALTSNVPVFGDGAYQVRARLSEVIRLGP